MCNAAGRRRWRRDGHEMTERGLAVARGDTRRRRERLFAEKGYEATSLKEIAEVAGFSRNTPHTSSASKRGGRDDSGKIVQ